MRKLNNNKLEALRNFKSIWHHNDVLISNTLKEDDYIREYITGTMRAKRWKISEIIIKRKVNNIHIIFQIHQSKKKRRKIWTKNRLKNRLKYEEKQRLEKRKRALKRIRIIKHMNKNKELTPKIKMDFNSLYFKENLTYLSFLILTQLQKVYQDNNISLYIQKSKPFYLNSNLVKCWIEDNMEKKKSYKRLIRKLIRKYKKIVSKYPISKSKFRWYTLKNEEKDKFISWFSTNLIYLFNINYYNNKYLLDNGPQSISLPSSIQSVLKDKEQSPFLRYSRKFYILKSRFSHLFYKFKLLDKKKDNNLSNKEIKKRRYLKNRAFKIKEIWSDKFKYVRGPIAYKR